MEKSCHFCLEIYKVFAKFTKEERFALTSQVRDRLYLWLPTLENKPLTPCRRSRVIVRGTLESSTPLSQLIGRGTELVCTKAQQGFTCSFTHTFPWETRHAI
ncbi:MAG: hypothetical protein GY849_01200 [Deltaproteobacteria bacterium]|nr:hypothetical protein [Deltaproteobacteria bacterium]